MVRRVDLDKSVAELVKEYPEVKNIMAEIGFKDITNPIALKTAGRVMTIPKGCEIKNIPLQSVVDKLIAAGFSVSYGSGDNADEEDDNKGRIRRYIDRLNEGENLESVREDFTKEFKDVSVHDIVGVEQDLISDGMQVSELSKLCDIHSALFHGKTEAEVWQQEEKAKAEAAAAEGADTMGDLLKTEGHPLQILHMENNVILDKVKSLEELVKTGSYSEVADGSRVGAVTNDLTELKDIKNHYAKKEELIFPLLEKHGVNGPSQVMWAVDDEIKRQISETAKKLSTDNFDDHKAIIQEKIINRLREMVYKEENILFPLAAASFSKDEWLTIYGDFPEMGLCFMEKAPKWDDGEKFVSERREEMKQNCLSADGKINLKTGSITAEQLQIMVDLLPVDLTLIDENDIVRFFTDKLGVFKRPLSALGREVYACHPPRVLPTVKRMIASFKDKMEDHMDVWMKNPANPVHVRYCAMYDDEGEYKGTLEIVESYKEGFERFGVSMK